MLLSAVGLAVDFFLRGGVVGIVDRRGHRDRVVVRLLLQQRQGRAADGARGARRPAEYARFHNLVEGLCIASGLPKPRLYIVDDPAPNAFSTGRNPKHAAVAVTTGLLEKMNRVELEGVLAHELSHIRNYDVLVMTLAVTMVGIIALISDFFLRMMFWTGGRGGARRQQQQSAGHRVRDPRLRVA